ncbi:MAG: glycyl-radical enzyme activating protein [Treponema sp.]|nr:glycyl-radical enzyme activating protein [Treponema sp.]
MAVSDTKVKEAIILDIQRMSTEDGPGLRTTVFFKGCNLACPWCHNPESIDRKSDLNWFSQKCMGCNICRDACPQKGISRDDNGINFNRPLCVACGSCVDACPQAAIELKGNAIGVEKLAAELVKDRAYFGADGGVTLSGGEVLIQHEAALELSRLIKAEGVNVAVDTAGCYDFRLLEAMLPYVDIVLYDLKIFDNEAHKQIVKGDNRLITENYRRLIDSNTRVWVRTPIIKGATDSEENIAAIGSFIANAGLPERWELCAFNNLCLDKYRRLDREWDYSGDGLTEKAHIEKLTEIAQRYVPCAIYTGAVKE